MNTKILLLINSWAGKNLLLDYAMIFCARYLILLVFLVAAGCIVYLLCIRENRAVLYFFATLLFEFIILQITALTFAHFYAERRPFMDHHLTQLIPHAAGKSFPSDHVSATIAIGMGLLLFTDFKKTGKYVLVAAALIGFARVFCGVHYPIDIVGAIVIGVLGALLVSVVQRVLPISLRYQPQPLSKTGFSL